MEEEPNRVHPMTMRSPLSMGEDWNIGHNTYRMGKYKRFRFTPIFYKVKERGSKKEGQAGPFSSNRRVCVALLTHEPDGKKLSLCPVTALLI